MIYQQRNVYTFILYLFGFFLLWEWLRPLTEITETGQLYYFIYFIAISLFLYFIQIRWWLGFPLKVAMMLFFLYRIFSIENISAHPWPRVFLVEIAANFKMLFSGNWFELSNLTRSFLFFVLLWLMTYLLRYWLTIRKRIFIFYLMTVIYITVLDTFTIYLGKWAIIRIVIIGFALISLLFFQRLMEKEQVGNRQKRMGKWALPLAVMIFASVFIGYLSPKAEPIWPDPVPFIQSTAENARSKNQVSTIGYGADDTQLGGPFIGDDRVVFEVKTPTRQYWKIETKDIYTGKGWVSADESDSLTRIEPGEIIPLEVAATTDEPIREATFDIKLPYSHIVRPYAFLSVEGNKKGYFQYDSSLDKFTSYSAKDELIKLKEYAIQYRRTAYSMKDMRATNALPTEHIYYAEIMDRYTQLPETLPFRVGSIAEDITAKHDNWFDKAKAIETYLSSAEFTYDQTDVAIPVGDQDYVDQFLFDTMRGYCDNFSTSMVVMLRAIGIPARWAKGYTAGNYKGNAGSEHQLYEVTNNEAHSWVEVFFPTEGWVPFEPTKGFANFATYMQDEEKNAVSPAVPNVIEDKLDAPKINEPTEEKKNLPNTSRKSAEIWPKIKTFTVEYWLVLPLLLLVIIALIIWLIRKRSRWMPYILLWTYKGRKGQETFVHAYSDLLKQLERFGVKRDPGQTLREYAAYIDKHLDTKDMSALTERYERTIYRGDSSEDEWNKVRELWENLIRRTTG